MVGAFFMFKIKGDDLISRSHLRIEFHEEDNTWELYNIHNTDLHTHSRHKRVLVKIKKDIDKQKLPTTRDLDTLESYTRVTTNRRYLRQIYRLIDEIEQGGELDLKHKNTICEKG